jgi:hypothetical protein
MPVHSSTHRGHNKILIKTISHRESRLRDIFNMNLNLMIAKGEINLGEHLGSS